MSPRTNLLRKTLKFMEEIMIVASKAHYKNSSKTADTEKAKKQEIIKSLIKSMPEEMKMKFWIKTLLSSQSTFPEIIKTLDRIIELQATSLSFASNIYNLENPTLNQIEKVIDLSERKTHLLNIFIMTKELTKGLSDLDTDFLEKKYVYNTSVECLAKEFEISPRTVYRRLDRLIDGIYEKLKKKNWSLLFLESQIKNESWLKSRFISQVSDYIKNSNYTNNKIFISQINHSQSSSESYLGNSG